MKDIYQVTYETRWKGNKEWDFFKVRVAIKGGASSEVAVAKVKAMVEKEQIKDDQGVLRRDGFRLSEVTYVTNAEG